MGSGTELDHQLVHNEQTVVQGVSDDLQKSNPSAYGKSIVEINTALNWLAGKALQEVAPSDRDHTGVLTGVRKDLGRNNAFANQGDRDAIRNALIRALRLGKQ